MSNKWGAVQTACAFFWSMLRQEGSEPRKGGRRTEKANRLAFSGGRRGGKRMRRRGKGLPSPPLCKKVQASPVLFCIKEEARGGEPGAADANRKSQLLGFFSGRPGGCGGRRRGDRALTERSERRLPSPPPKQNQTNFYFWTTGFAVRVAI